MYQKAHIQTQTSITQNTNEMNKRMIEKKRMKER